MPRLLLRILLAAGIIAFYCAVAASFAVHPVGTFSLLSAFIIMAFGLFVLIRNPSAPLNRSFFYLSASLGSYAAVVYLLHLATKVGIGRVETGVWLLRTGNLVSPALLMLFTYRFTGGSSKWLRRFCWLALVTVVPFMVLNFLGLHVQGYREIGLTYAPLPSISYQLCAVVTIFWFLVSFSAVLLAWVRSQEEGRRRQYLLFLGGWLFAAVPSLLGFVTAFNKTWFPSFFGLSLAVFPITLGVAVVRFNLFDIKIVIRRTLPYAVGTALIGAFYAACLAGLEALGASLDVLPNGTGWVVFLVLVGLAFQPVLEGLQKGLDRLFFRAEAELDRFLAQAGPRYLAAGSPAVLARMATADARGVLKLEGAAVLLGQDKIFTVTTEGGAGALHGHARLSMPGKLSSREPVTADEAGKLPLGEGAEQLSAALSAAGIRLAVPFGEGPTRGILACGQKLSHLPFTPRDKMFLVALASQVETALSRLEAKRDAESAHKLTEAVFESMTNAVALVARDGRVTDCNPAFQRAFGISEGQVVPASDLSALLPAERAGGLREVETPHGTFLVSARRLEGRDEAILAVLTDITELRRLQETDRKRAALAEIGATVSAINHEIGNILTPLNYQLNKVAQAGSLEDTAKPLQVARERVSALERLGRELREFYKEPQLMPRKVRLRDVVESTLADMRAAAGSGWVPPELSGLDVEVTADIQKLKQVLLNIVKNAWEAMQDSAQKHWTVAVITEGGKTLIAIRDSGSGIPPECQKRLFQPFFTTKKERGTGLGLAIVKRIVEAHGAEIRIESHPGAGTTVTIFWPLSG